MLVVNSHRVPKWPLLHFHRIRLFQIKMRRCHIKCTYLLDLLQYINVFLGLGSLNWRQHFRGGLQCLIEGKNHSPSREAIVRSSSKIASSKGYLLAARAQDAAGFHCRKGTLGSHSTCCQPGPLLWNCFPASCPRPVLLQGISLSQMQNLALALEISHEIRVSIHQPCSPACSLLLPAVWCLWICWGCTLSRCPGSW